MRLTPIIVLLAVAGLALLLAQSVSGDVARWAMERQRELQNAIAGGVRAVRAGDPGAWTALLGAAGAYGFVHALGPGHGKYLIGGVGLGAGVPGGRLLGIAAVASLAQALWGILLVYGGFLLLEVSARRLTFLAEEILAPASYLAIGLVGLFLAWRGGRALWRDSGPSGNGGDGESDACGCHAHGPDPARVASLGSLREATALIGSIAIRPCTGAIFLLVIAWQLDLRAAGAAAVVVMGLGTALLTGLVAVSSVAIRGLAHTSSGRLGALATVAPALQLGAGALILWFSATMLRLALA